MLKTTEFRKRFLRFPFRILGIAPGDGRLVPQSATQVSISEGLISTVNTKNVFTASTIQRSVVILGETDPWIEDP